MIRSGIHSDWGINRGPVSMLINEYLLKKSAEKGKKSSGEMTTGKDVLQVNEIKNTRG